MAMTVLPNALRSHDPLSFCSKPPAQPDNIKTIATRLQYVSNYKLRSEASHEEPRLRQLLGHIAVYDNIRAWHINDAADNTTQTNNADADDSNELSDYLRHVPSFQEFQAAIQVQLATMAEVSASALQMTVEEYESDSAEDSDYDSHDGDNWSDDETSTESDDSSGSLTDVELVEIESCSRSSTPTSELLFGEDDLGAATLQPQTQYYNCITQL